MVKRNNFQLTIVNFQLSIENAVSHKNGKASEVARDATAEACSILGPILETTCSRPGPASVRSARGWRLHTSGLAQTVARDRSAASAHPTGWRGGFPTGRPWDFASSRSAMRISPHTFPALERSCDRPRRTDPTTRSRTLIPRIRRPSPSAATCPTVGPRIRLAVTGRLGRPGSGVSPVGGLSPRGSRRHVRRH